jgi:hypothetical protein
MRQRVVPDGATSIRTILARVPAKRTANFRDGQANVSVLRDPSPRT